MLLVILLLILLLLLWLCIAGCLPLLIQLLHGGGPGAGGLFGSMRGCAAARVRAAQALRNIVTSNPDSHRSRREERVLHLLEQVRAYCDRLATDSDTDEGAEHQDVSNVNIHPGLQSCNIWLVLAELCNFFSKLHDSHISSYMSKILNNAVVQFLLCLQDKEKRCLKNVFILTSMSRQAVGWLSSSMHRYHADSKERITRKGGNYSDVLPLKAVRRDSISNLTSFGASNLSCR